MGKKKAGKFFVQVGRSKYPLIFNSTFSIVRDKKGLRRLISFVTAPGSTIDKNSVYRFVIFNSVSREVLVALPLGEKCYLMQGRTVVHETVVEKVLDAFEGGVAATLGASKKGPSEE